MCLCDYVVKREPTFCLRCECKYETRSETTIKYIVIFVIISFSVLIIYMLIIIVQQRWKSQQLTIVSDQRQEQLRNVVAESPSRAERSESNPSGSRPVYRRISSMPEELEKKINTWQVKVDAQRENVYRKFTMLS